MACSCISQVCPQPPPSIVQCGRKGEGIIARTDYEANLFLGELTGEIAPLKTYNDGWAATICDDERPLCQVYSLYMGNWVRKVNSSCKPNARLVCLPISGKIRVMLQTTEAIEGGREITVWYGREYWAKATCLCGEEECIHRERNKVVE